MATRNTPLSEGSSATEPVVQKAVPLQTPAPIPNPPGGGRWRWDADASQWLPND